MASGLPVVGLHAEGVCDIVADGQTGFLLNIEEKTESEQIAGYQQLLTRLVEQPALRQTMSAAAIETARQRTWDEAMNSLILGYQEVVHQEQPLIAA